MTRGNDDAHAGLLSFFPGAVSAECNEDGIWATATTSDGERKQAYCPGCRRAKLNAAIALVTPPRFSVPVPLLPEIEAWAKRGREAEGLYITGPVGTGKTHAAWSAVAAWCSAAGVTPTVRETDSAWGDRHGPNLIFTRMTDLLDDLRPGDDTRRRIRDCQNAALLAVDDLGAEKASEWTQERFYSIVDHRYANKLPLIVTSNLPTSQIAAQTGDRAASRLAEMSAVVRMTGTDRRKRS